MCIDTKKYDLSSVNTETHIFSWIKINRIATYIFIHIFQQQKMQEKSKFYFLPEKNA